ncbi:MAG: formate transporter FocA [bacterium]|nr:formate transporter FocA [bacterium]
MDSNSKTNHTVKSNDVFRIDAFLPQEMALKAESVGVAKAKLSVRKTFVLGILAGAFIAMGAIFATTVTAGAGGQMSYGMTKFMGGLVFCLGLILVVVAGAELFTGNNLIIMAWADKKVSTGQVLRNWVIVYLGNFAGAAATAVFMLYTGQYAFGKGAVGLNILNIANAKSDLGFVQAIALGIMCNALVCLAVWLCYSARSTTDKILSIIFPITAFVAAGFEHCIANMFFIPMGLLVKATAGTGFWEMIGKTAADYGNLTVENFFIVNLLPVTIGNIIGGSVMVGLVYWAIFLRKKNRGSNT